MVKHLKSHFGQAIRLFFRWQTDLVSDHLAVIFHRLLSSALIGNYMTAGSQLTYSQNGSDGFGRPFKEFQSQVDTGAISDGGLDHLLTLADELSTSGD